MKSILEAIVGSTSDAIVTADAQGQVITWNPAAERIFGYSEDEILGQPLTLLIPERFRAAHEAGLSRVVRTGQTKIIGQTMQLTGLRKSGDEFPIELSLATWVTDGTRFLSGIIRDVSDREKALENLTQSEERLRAIMDSTQDAIICADESGHVVLWNPAAEKMFGQPETDMLGKPLIAIIPERHHVAHDAGIRRLNMNKEPRAVGKTIELSALREDGSEIPIELSLGSWTIGERHYFSGIIRNITDRKQAEKAVREKTEFLQLTQVITRAANEAVSVKTVMQLALDQVCAHTGWSVGHLYTLDESTGELVSGGIWHIDDADKFSTFRRVTETAGTAKGASLPGRVLTSGNPAWIEDITKDPRFPRAQLAIELGVRGAFAFPVLIGREIAAVLEFFSEDTAEPYQPLLEVMAQIGTQLGRVIERKRASERASAEFFRIEEELQSARELQSAMLPRHFSPPTPQRPVECTAMMQPAKEVGGDFYDVIELDEKCLGIVIADVAGKGAGAALFMARAFTILDAAARRGGRPGEVLSHLNDLLCVSNDKVIFVTVFYGVFDSSTTTLTFANAGHNPPILIRSDRRVETLQPTGGVAVGVKPNLEYRESSIEIGPGDTVFCYTDGFTEAKNPANQEFSVTNLEKVLADCAQVPVEDIPGRVIEGVNEFTENAPPFDDMTCVVMRHIMAQHA